MVRTACSTRPGRLDRRNADDRSVPQFPALKVDAAVNMAGRIVRSVLSRTAVFPLERWSADFWRARFGRRRPPNAAPLVMLEAVEDVFLYNLQAQLVCALGEVRVGRWVSASLGYRAAASLRDIVATMLDRRLFSGWKWRRLYDVFCTGPCEYAGRWRAPWKEIAYLLRARRIFDRLQTKDQLAALVVDGIRIGDLVIDTYLRFRPCPELNLRDRYLISVLRQAIKDIDSCRAYFGKTRPSLYLTTYTTYIQHGVPARVAVSMGIATWAAGNAQEYGTRLSAEHLVQTRRSLNYSRDFAKLKQREARIAEAAQALGGRLSGVADTVTSFQKSAYEVRTLDVPDVRGAAVVFLHDFYDSPHIYRWMIFHDFWEWTCVTIETLLETGLPFVVKPHPSQRAESVGDLERLAEKYPSVRIISPEISNRQLVDGGMACAITVYGSVAAEMAFMGVPSIACGDNPRVSFDAFVLATGKAQYLELVRDFPNLSYNESVLKEQACAFYYMHNLSDGPEALELRERVFDYINYMFRLKADDPFDPQRLAQLLNGIDATAGFKQLVAALRTDIERGQEPAQSPEEAQQCLTSPS